MEETRFSRGDMCDWGYIMSVCDATGLKLATPSGIFYDPRDPNTRMMVWLKGGMSEAEKLRFMDRARGGKKTCLQLGFLPHGCAPFGYRAVRYGPKPAHKRLEVVDDEARIVRLIFRLAVYGEGSSGPMGTVRIAHYLNEVERVPPPSAAIWGRVNQEWASRFTGRWASVSVRKILDNPVYKGIWPFGRREPVEPQRPRSDRPRKTPRSSQRARPQRLWQLTEPGRKVLAPGELEPKDLIPAIVDEELWEAAQSAIRRRDNRSHPGCAPQEERALLVGFLVCPDCGYGFIQFRDQWKRRDGTRHERRCYTCNGRTLNKRKGKPPCRNRRWAADEVEEAVWKHVADLIRSPEMLASLVRESEEEQEPVPVDLSEAAVQRLIADLDKRRRKMVVWAQDGTITEADLKADTAVYTQAREELENRLSRMAEELETHRQWERSIREAMDLCTLYRQRIDGADTATRRAVLEEMVDKVTLAEDGTLNIHYLFARVRPRLPLDQKHFEEALVPGGGHA
jgi:hypothetical protein